MNILAIGAHPDDIELGCAGTLIKHIEKGDKVYALVMTDGEKGKHKFREESLNSAKILGFTEIFFGGFPDGFLVANFNSVSLIEDYIKKLNIEKVYTHFPDDRHQDHRNCSLAVSSAARKIGQIFLFQGPSTNITFDPHYFVEISEDNLNKKIQSISSYQTQIKKGSIFTEWAESVARNNGFPHGLKYSEAFSLNHIVMSGKNV